MVVIITESPETAHQWAHDSGLLLHEYQIEDEREGRLYRLDDRIVIVGPISDRRARKLRRDLAKNGQLRRRPKMIEHANV